MTWVNGQTMQLMVCLSDPQTQAMRDADNANTCIVCYVNQTYTNVYASAVKVYTGAYKIDCPLPTVAIGDTLTLIAWADVAGVSAHAVVFQDVYTGEPIEFDYHPIIDALEQVHLDDIAAFLTKWTQNKGTQTVDGVTGVITYAIRNNTDTADYCYWTVDPATGVKTAVVFV
jgi:hypothetical protein